MSDDEFFQAEFDNSIEIAGDAEQGEYIAKKLEYMARMLRQKKIHIIINASICMTKKVGPVTQSRYSGFAGAVIEGDLPLKGNFVLLERFVKVAQKVSENVLQEIKKQRQEGKK